MEYIKSLFLLQSGTLDKTRSNLRYFYTYFSLGVISFLLGQAEIAPGFFTFFLIFVALTITEKSIVLFSILAGGMLGLFLSRDIFLLAYLTAPTVIIIIRLIKNKEREQRLAIFALLISVFYFIVASIINYYQDALLYFYLLRLGESLAVFFFVLLFQGLDYISVPEREQYTVRETVLLIVVTSGVLIGLVNLTDSVILLNILVILLILGADLTTGTLLATILGMIFVSTGIIPLIIITKYIFTALVSGLINSRRKLIILSTLPVIFLLYSGFSPSLYNLKRSLLELAIAGALFLLIPNRYWKKIFNIYPSLRKSLPAKAEAIQHYNPEIREQLQEMAAIFTELSTTFLEVLPVKEEENINRLNNFIFLFRKKNCSHCLRQKICWQQELETARKTIARILVDIEKKDDIDKNQLVKSFNDFCPFVRQIAGGIRSCLELYQINNFWRKKLIDKQQIVSAQLAGISEIISDFSGNSRLDIEQELYLENIKEKIIRNNIKLYDIKGLSCQGSKKNHLKLKVDACSGNKPCQQQITGILNEEFPYRFRLIEHECGNRLKDRPCSLHYGPAGRFFLKTAFIRQAIEGDVCGDSFLYRKLIRGEDVIIISDGMGVGSRAAAESRRAVKLFTTIVEAGFTQKLAIKIINSALYLRHREENFTTLDIAYFDTFSGRLLMYKTGAMPTFVKRGWEVKVLQSSSLPAGILQELEIESQTFQLQQDDYVFMFSDGLLDMKTDVLDSESWFKQLLMSTSLESPEAYTQYIMEKIKAGGQLTDDVTLLVFKVRKEQIGFAIKKSLR